MKLPDDIQKQIEEAAIKDLNSRRYANAQSFIFGAQFGYELGEKAGFDKAVKMLKSTAIKSFIYEGREWWGGSMMMGKDWSTWLEQQWNLGETKND